MNWSDETDYFDFSTQCPFISNNMDCDEHLCLSHQWSCDDGQCITRQYRFPFFPVADGFGCDNFRESRYMCETNAFVPMWTEYPINSNDAVNLFGSCWEKLLYQEKNCSSLTQNETCIIIIRNKIMNNLFICVLQCSFIHVRFFCINFI